MTALPVDITPQEGTGRAIAQTGSSSISTAMSMSVVICTRDRPESLRNCLCSVLRQNCLPIELIVVDDGRLAARHRESILSDCRAAGVRFVYLHKEVPGLPASRNYAVRHARGDILQFLDDDVELDADFFRHIMRLYSLDDHCTVIGIDGTVLDANPSSVARMFESVYRLAGWWAVKPKSVRRVPLPPPLRDRRWAVPTWTLSGTTMSFRREVLLRHAFDEGLTGYALGEDRDMSLRVAPEGLLLRSRGARAVHHHVPAGRPNHVQFGSMTVHNYVRIMGRIGRTSIGDRIVIGYTLALIAATLTGCTVLKPRRYGPELLGLLTAAAELGGSKIIQLLGPGFSRRHRGFLTSSGTPLLQSSRSGRQSGLPTGNVPKKRVPSSSVLFRWLIRSGPT